MRPPIECLRCGVLFVPAEGQWIFYTLCDHCFALFDAQKMAARNAFYYWIQKDPTTVVAEHSYNPESVIDWIEHEALIDAARTRLGEDL